MAPTSPRLPIPATPKRGRGRPPKLKPAPLELVAGPLPAPAEPDPAPPTPRRYLCLGAPPPGVEVDRSLFSAGVVTMALNEAEADRLNLMPLED